MGKVLKVMREIVSENTGDRLTLDSMEEPLERSLG